MNRSALLLVLVLSCISTCARAADISWAQVDRAIGRKGADQPGGVHKYSFPRSDLNVTVDGVAIKPALALGGWVAFQPAGTGAMFMGDLVLTDSEINPVMARLIADGVQITAVHNHLLRTSVPVFYMHVGGHGDPVKLAETLHSALALSKTPLAAASRRREPTDPSTSIRPPRKGIGLQRQRQWWGLPVQCAASRGNLRRGMGVPPSMGTAISMNFEPTGVARRRSPGTSYCSGARSTRYSRRCANTESKWPRCTVT